MGTRLTPYHTSWQDPLGLQKCKLNLDFPCFDKFYKCSIVCAHYWSPDEGGFGTYSAGSEWVSELSSPHGKCLFAQKCLFVPFERGWVEYFFTVHGDRVVHRGPHYAVLVFYELQSGEFTLSSLVTNFNVSDNWPTLCVIFYDTGVHDKSVQRLTSCTCANSDNAYGIKQLMLC